MEEKRKYFRKTFKQNENSIKVENIDSITFEDSDSLLDKAKKTVLLYAGSPNLKKEMERLKVNYTKVERKTQVIYVLRHSSFDKTEVVL